MFKKLREVRQVKRTIDDGMGMIQKQGKKTVSELPPTTPMPTSKATRTITHDGPSISAS